MLSSLQSSNSNQDRLRSWLPIQAGLCLKPQHYKDILETLPDVGWFEVHAENYLGSGGAPLHFLEKIRNHYELSVHGVGLSIGSSQGLDETHLSRVADMVKRFQPASFSEHLAWSTHDNQFYSDLLPVPYNKEVEDVVCDHIDQLQTRLGRRMLLENPSNYLLMENSTQDETQMLNNIVQRTGCGLLLDVNNVFISAHNCGYDAINYISALPLDAVGEIHLAGHATDTAMPNEPLLIDTHDREVADPVWKLYEKTLKLAGPKPTLIEWDASVPDWSVFLQELQQADLILNSTASSNLRVDAG